MSEQPPAAPMQLKSFEPDLDVVVGSGEEQQVFRYHAVILASYSTYIDTMLSMPMKEQNEMKISFPDIAPVTWLKLIKAQGPQGTGGLNLSEMNELAPLYDKYGFHGGLAAYDRVISLTLDKCYQINDSLVRAAALSYQFDLPKSKNVAIKYATRRLEGWSSRAPEDTNYIKELLPLIHNDEDMLRYVVCTVGGRANGMSVEEMRSVIEEDSFAAQYQKRCLQITEQEDMLGRLEISKLDIRDAGSVNINGEYNREGSSVLTAGAMNNVFKKYHEGTEARLEAIDPFGKTWRLSIFGNDGQPADGEGRRRVLHVYQWESDYGSLVPPRTGWSVGPDGEHPAPWLDFNFKFGRYY